MPLPLILGAAAAIAGAAGIGMGVRGAAKMKEAKEDIEWAREKHKENLERLEKSNKETCAAMDRLGSNEMDILASFKEFADLFATIKKRPVFKDIEVGGVKIPEFKSSEIKDVSLNAAVLSGALSGAALGTAGAYAASGATTAAVAAFGTASTGTLISGLSGAAATNATLAALGGGSLAAGGGGMALGSMVLGGATLGVGLLVGGAIFSMAGSKISDQADEAKRQMWDAEEKIEKIRKYLNRLASTADKYNSSLLRVYEVYCRQLNEFKAVIDAHSGWFRRPDWEKFSDEERLIVQNTVGLVQVLYSMCKVQLVLKSEKKDDESEQEAINRINTDEVNSSMSKASSFVAKLEQQSQSTQAAAAITATTTAASLRGELAPGSWANKRSGNVQQPGEVVKSLIGLAVIIAFYSLFVLFNGSSFVLKTSQWYNWAMTPATSLASDGNTVRPMKVVNCDDPYTWSRKTGTRRFCSMGSNNDITSFVTGAHWSGINFYEGHNNWLSRIATLGNRSSLENLNLAYRMAKFQRNYSLYLFDSRGKAEFMATATDGPTVVMYSLSWIINIPQKIARHLATIIFDFDTLAKNLELETSSSFMIFIMVVIDFLVSLLGYFCDFWLALGNIFVGGILGCLFHPVDSICSLTGLVYFAVPTVWSAFVEFIYAFWHILF